MSSRPTRPAPSSRVYVAFGIAAVIGLAVFLIWWVTSPRQREGVGEGAQTSPRDGEPSAAGAAQGAQPPATSAVIETALPRGGTLRGSTDDLERAVTSLTDATLVRINRGTDRVEPWLAESWTASPDNLTYTLKLRPDTRWSDGTPFTAEDAVASLATAFMPALGVDKPIAAGKLGLPLTSRVVDPLTLEIKFPVPFAPGLRLLDRHPIRPRHTPADNVRLGPFIPQAASAARSSKQTASSLQTQLTFARNPQYWRKAPDGSPLPYLDGLVLTSGSPTELDFADSAIPPEDIEQVRKLEEAGKLRVFDLGPGLGADALWFTPAVAPGRGSGAKAGEAGRQSSDDVRSVAGDRPWLASEAFRLAISTAVDRREYCKQVFFDACDPVAGPVSPANAAWFNPDMPVGRPNPQIARGMLGELGLRDRDGDGMLDDAARREIRFSLLIDRDVASAARAATFIAETLRGIGVAVEVVPVTAGALRARREKGNYDAIYDRIEMRDTDPAMNLDFWLSSGEAHVWNPPRTGAPADWERQIDQLMIKNASTFDRIERLQAFVEAQKIYHQHMPAIFFGVPYVRIITSVKTLNATPSLLRPHVLWNSESLAALK